MNKIITRYIVAPILAGVQRALTFVSGTQTMVLDPTNGLDLTNCGFTTGQTWKNVTASRSLGTTYYNTTSKPIKIIVGVSIALAANLTMTCTINGTAIVFGYAANDANPTYCLGGIEIPVGASFVVSASSGTLQHWAELR